MAWKVELSRAARKSLKKLDPEAARRVLLYLHTNIEGSSDPRRSGAPLHGSTLGNLWRYRVGDYRIIADLKDEIITVLILRIGHRRDIYRKAK